MKVRGKFFVKSKSEAPVWGKDGYDRLVTNVTLGAIFASGADGKNAVAENHVFSESTPCAEISMTIANQECADGFKTGRSYYVDFTPAD